MIEAEIIQYLSKYLPYPVYAERPENKDAKFYLVERVGGNLLHGLYHSMFAIQSIVSNARASEITLIDAIEMNDLLIKTMINDDGGALKCPDVVKVELNSNYNFTDPDTDEYKYQAVFDINHY